MDFKALRCHNLESLYFQYHRDSKWSFFKENVIPSLVNLKCCACNHSFSCDFTLKRHYSSFHVDILPTGVFNASSNRVFRCEHCNKEFSRQDKLTEHIRFSKQHKEVVSSKTNVKMSINDLFMAQKSNSDMQKKPEQEQEQSQPFIKNSNAKKRKFDSNEEYKSEKDYENRNESLSNKPKISNKPNVSEKNKEIVDQVSKIKNKYDLVENECDIIEIEEIQSSTTHKKRIDQLNQKELLQLKAKIEYDYKQSQQKYILIKKHLKKFE